MLCYFQNAWTNLFATSFQFQIVRARICSITFSIYQSLILLWINSIGKFSLKKFVFHPYTVQISLKMFSKEDVSWQWRGLSLYIHFSCCASFLLYRLHIFWNFTSLPIVTVAKQRNANSLRLVFWFCNTWWSWRTLELRKILYQLFSFVLLSFVYVSLLTVPILPVLIFPSEQNLKCCCFTG